MHKVNVRNTIRKGVRDGCILFLSLFPMAVLYHIVMPVEWFWLNMEQFRSLLDVTCGIAIAVFVLFLLEKVRRER